jgi:hypothetical protein
MRRGPGPLPALLVAAALGPGCSVTIGRLAVASPERIPARLAVEPGRPVTGRDCVPIVVLFPLARLPKLGRAFAAAVDAGRGTTLSDVTMRYELWYVPFVYGRACYAVDGMVS